MSTRDNKIPLGIIFRQKREEKGLLIRQVAAVTELDQAIISRIENCDRIPTKEQAMRLAGLYNLDVKEIESAWLAERMVRDYGQEPFITEALSVAHERILFDISSKSAPGSRPILSYIDPSDKDEAVREVKAKRGRKKNPGK